MCLNLLNVTVVSMTEHEISSAVLVVVSDYADEGAADFFSLHEELRHLPGITVDVVPSDEAPPAGSKAGVVATLGTLAVSAATGQMVLKQLIGVVRAWVERGTHRRVRIQIGPHEVIEINGDVADQREIIEKFLDRRS